MKSNPRHIDKTSTMRGHGPPPPGMVTCHDPKCPARRSPFTGRMTKKGTHYHPIRENPLTAGNVIVGAAVIGGLAAFIGLIKSL